MRIAKSTTKYEQKKGRKQTLGNVTPADSLNSPQKAFLVSVLKISSSILGSETRYLEIHRRFSQLLHKEQNRL